MTKCISVLVLLSSLVLQVRPAADTTLFDDNDDVVIYKADTYLIELYNGQTAHMLLLYSSYCGHCQRFAPIYREYATAVKGWSREVLVSGIDCVYDTAVCRNFNVGGYPTIRFIGPTTNISDTGIDYDKGRTVRELENYTLTKLSEVENAPPHWPKLQPLTKKEIDSLETLPNRPIKVIIVSTNEDVAREVLLDLQNVKLRYVRDGSPAAAALGARSAGLVVVSQSGKKSHISNIDENVNELKTSIRKILLLGDSTSDDEADDSDSEDKIQEAGELEYVDTTLQYKLHELDLQSAINTALYMEVGLKSNFTETELEDLKNFLSVVHRCGSWTLDYKKQLSKIKKALSDVTTLTNTGWSAILSSAADEGFPRNSTFVGCKGSRDNTRGFSCSMWLLFHTMLTSCYKTAPGSVAVLHALHGYISSFFTCLHCQTHFLAMAERLQLLQITEDETAVLAFWEAHNQVNHRLSGELQDPYFPKVQFPPASLCEKCSDPVTGQFNSDQVFGFLMRHYRRVLTPFGKLRLVEQISIRDNSAVLYRTRSSHLKGASGDYIIMGFDFGCYLFVCMCCTGVLLACFLFLWKRKLRIFNFGFNRRNGMA